MNRYQNYAFVVASISLGLLAADPAQAASVTQVNRATWGATGVPSYVTMYIYVPDQLAAKPPVVVACHSCGTPVDGYKNSIQGILAGADKNGFIVILPEATGQNCWDVGTTKSLTHDGGGDTQAIAQMVKYTLTKYNGDPSRVYALGGSSGAMMTQALMAVYPDIFKAGSARAGVPAGCWADGFAASNQWSNNCAGGNTTKTAMQWGDQVRGMYPGYTGPRPRLQIFHGTNDQTISYKNMAESVKEWTNVLKLSEMPSSTDSVTTPVATYDRRFWKNACGYTVFEAWAGKNGSHSMAYEEDAILAFFGLDKAGGSDPEPACGQGGGGMGGAGSGGSGGVSPGGAGGTSNAGAGAGAGTGPGAGAGGSGIAGGGGASGNVGTGGSGPRPGGGGGAGGNPSSAGTPGAGGSVAGTTGIAGNPATGGSGGSGGSGAGGKPSGVTAGSPSAAGSSASPPPEADSGGCSIALGKEPAKPISAAVVTIGLALLAFRRRRRSARR